MKKLNNTKKTLLISVVCVPLFACAGQYKPHDGEQMSDDRISDYSFAVGKNGEPIVRSRKTNKLLKGKRIQPGESIKASSIEEVETITIIRAKGSHFFEVYIGGVASVFPLPHDE